MNELIQAALKGALVGAEKVIESLKALDEFVHETIDGSLHKLLAYWEAVAADLRSRLGIMSAAGDELDIPDSLKASAASFCDDVQASAA